MKRCPECNRTYAGESITFCLADGALLSAPYDSEATQRIAPARSANPPPTEILPSHSIRQKGNSKFIYVIIAIMAALIIGLAGIVIVPRMSQRQTASSDINQARYSNDASVNEPSKGESRETSSAKSKESLIPKPTVTASNPNNSNLSSAIVAVTGRWQGQWSSPYGTIFSADVYLEESGTNNGVQGYINWTMKSTPQESKQSKVGLKAVEFVKGSYNSETRLLTMEGHREDDPNDIISLDK